MLCFAYNMPFLLAPFKLKLSSAYEEKRPWIGIQSLDQIFAESSSFPFLLCHTALVQFHYPCPRFQTKVSKRLCAIPSSVSDISNTTSVGNRLSAIRLSMPVRFQTKMWRKDSVQFHYPCPRFQTKVSNRFSAIRLSMSEISNKRVEKA